MRSPRFSRLVVGALALAALTTLPAWAATEVKGAAILDHPCGKVAVKHMGLVHAGKMEDAVKLGTAEMQQQWKDLDASDREMMTGMMKEMSQSEEDFSAAIKKNGLLTIDGTNATLTTKVEHKDENGTSTETTTQRYVFDGKSCQITH